MLIERRIDNLIEAGWQVLLSDFDEEAFFMWRKEALKCVAAIMGPDHTYTRYFKEFSDGGDRLDLLSGGGILAAMKEQIGGAARQPAPNDAVPNLAELLPQRVPEEARKGESARSNAQRALLSQLHQRDGEMDRRPS